jgi:hypothetical protein
VDPIHQISHHYGQRIGHLCTLSANHYSTLLFVFLFFFCVGGGGEVEEIGSNSLGLDKRLTLEGH